MSALKLPPNLETAVQGMNHGLLSPQALIITLSALAGLGSRDQGPRDSAGNLISPRTNTIIIDDSGPYLQNLLQNLFTPISKQQRALVDESQACNKKSVDFADAREIKVNFTNDIINPHTLPNPQTYNAGVIAMRRKFEIIRYPFLYLRSPDLKTLNTGFSHSVDNSILLHLENLFIFKNGRQSSESRSYNKAIVKALQGHSVEVKTRPSETYKKIVNPICNAIIRTTESALQAAILSGDDSLREIIKSSLLVRWNKQLTPPIMLRPHPKPWDDILEHAFLERRYGNDVWRFCPEHDKHLVFSGWEDSLNESLEDVDESISPFIGSWIDLPVKIAGQILITGRFFNRESIDDACETGFRMALWAVKRKAEILHKLFKDGKLLLLETNKEVMLKKLRMGPLSFSNLLRKYDQQKSGLHRPTLEALFEDGAVHLNSDGLIEIAKKKGVA